MLASIGAFTAQYGLTIPGYTAVADPVQNLNTFVLDWPLGFTQVRNIVTTIRCRLHITSASISSRTSLLG